MQIKNHFLFNDEGMQIEFKESPHQSGSIKPIYLIIHYTTGTTLDGTVTWFQNPKAKASAHLIIGRDGKIVQMVALNKRAWHAGKSSWGNLSGLNGYSIGIELVNGGRLTKNADGKWCTWAKSVIDAKDVEILKHKDETEATGWHNYTEAQIKSVIEASMALHETYDFTDILGHDDISPGRKKDPGPAFPMDSFRSKVLGRSDEHG